MADWKIVRFDKTYKEPLDAEIIPLCDALNAAGFVTISSCAGHGRDWARVWFEHSTDERIEKLARFVMKSEGGDFRPFFSLFQKEILLDGYRWMIEIHLNDVYRTTPTDDFLKKTIFAINQITERIKMWHSSELLAVKG